MVLNSFLNLIIKIRIKRILKNEKLMNYNIIVKISIYKAVCIEFSVMVLNGFKNVCKLRHMISYEMIKKKKKTSPGLPICVFYKNHELLLS